MVHTCSVSGEVMRKIPPELSANTLAFSDDGLKAMQLGTYVLDVNLSLGVSGIFRLSDCMGLA